VISDGSTKAAILSLAQEVIEAGFSLPTNGEISEIIETRTGLYLVARLDARDGG